MYKLIAIYKKPQDMEKFESHYKDNHTPLVRKVPGLKEIRLNRVTGTPGGESDLHLIAELCFETKDDFKAAMKSEENMAAGKDLMKFAGDIVSVHFAKEERA